MRNTAVMSIGTALSRLTGFARLAAMAAALGVAENRLADTYNVANTTPNIVYELVLGGVLSSVFVPVFVDWRQHHGDTEAWDVAHRVMTLTFTVLAAVALLGILLAPAIIDLYMAGDVPESSRSLGAFFLRWFAPQIVFYGLGAVAAGLLNAHRRFAAPMFAPVLNNLVAIGTFVTFVLMPGPDPASPETISLAQKSVLAIGTTLGVVAMTVALWPTLRRTGWRWRWNFRFRHEAVSRIAHLAKWTVVYVAVNQVGLFVVIKIATREQGDFTAAWAFAFILFQLPHAIFSVSVFTALLPRLSARWSANDVPGYRSLLGEGMRLTAVVLIPAAFGYLALSLPITRLLFAYGNTSEASAELIASALIPFAIGLFPFSLFQLLLRAFYAQKDSRTPALINVAAMAVTIAANLFLYFVLDLGVQGLALGFSVGYWFATAFALLVLRRRVGRLEGRRTLSTVGRVVGASAATGAVAWGVAIGLEELVPVTGFPSRALQVLGSVTAGVLVFVGAALILRIDEVDTVKETLTARFRG
ncbi:MAG: murein biosynthesis integral membrane protein MurJ [Actinomycetota bacterium]